MHVGTPLIIRWIRSISLCSRQATLWSLLLLVCTGLSSHVGASSPPTTPAPPDTLHIDPASVDTLASFEAPTALHRDPRGRLYVLESDRHRFHVLNPQGEPLHTIGGRGRSTGQFDRPQGLDPTNGQVLLVADTGNGRIQRFDDTGRHLETLPISHRDESLRSTFQTGRDEWASQGTGRPHAVRTGTSGGLVVLESDARAIWYLDDRRRTIRRLTPFDVPFDDWTPHALARSAEREFWIVDEAAPHLLITDAFGSRVAQRTLTEDHAPHDVFATGRAVGLVYAHHLALYDAARYAKQQHITWPAAHPPVRAATASRTGLYLLVGSHLLYTPRSQ